MNPRIVNLLTIDLRKELLLIMGHCVDDPEARGILNLCPEDKLVGGFNMFQYVSICFNHLLFSKPIWDDDPSKIL